jgi:hypothetical protein
MGHAKAHGNRSKSELGPSVSLKVALRLTQAKRKEYGKVLSNDLQNQE